MKNSYLFSNFTNNSSSVILYKIIQMSYWFISSGYRVSRVLATFDRHSNLFKDSQNTVSWQC